MHLIRTLSSLKYLRWAEESVKEDDRKWVHFRDGKISSGRKKSQGSNIGDSDNTKDEGKTVGEAIGACGGIAGALPNIRSSSNEMRSYGSTLLSTRTGKFNPNRSIHGIRGTQPVYNPSSNPTPSTNLNPKGRNRRRSKQRIEGLNLDELSPPIVTMADQRTMAQLLQAPTEGYEDAIVVPAITPDNFELKHAQIWLEKEPSRSIFTWDDLVAKFINQFFPPSKTTNIRNEITNFQQRFDESFSEAWNRFKDLLRACPHHGFSELHQLDTFYNALNLKDQDSLNSAAGAYILANDAVMRNMQTQGQNTQNQLTNLTDLLTKFVNSNNASTSSSRTLPSNTIATREVVENEPEATKDTVHPTNNGNTENVQPLVVQTETPVIQISKPVVEPVISPVVENEPEATKDTVNPTKNGSTEDVQPPVVPTKSPILTSKPVNSPTTKHVASLVSAPRPNLRPLIPYPSRMQDQKLRDKANDQREKFFQIFKDFNFNISFADALILMPKCGPSIKSLLTNKDKLCELARTALNEHCSTVLLKKLPEKLGDPELADRSISRPVGVAEDVYVKVGTFYFPADFVVIDFDADPRVPLILRRSFLKTEKALIDVFEGELTLRVGKEAITFNLDQTSTYSANYNNMTAKLIDVIDMACEEYSQKVLGFSDVIAIVDAFLALEDDPTSSEVYLSYLDSEGDILLLEAFLNDDPTLPHPNQGNYMPEVRKELKICEAKSNKSSIDEPPEVERKDLPPHLEYAFLEGDDKLPVIIAKDLSVEEKTALITVLKSHKRAITWKLSDIKGIDPEFCTHKILMEEDFKPAV
nr:hypothetical protein [Tanacetum cinerariifolium]